MDEPKDVAAAYARLARRKALLDRVSDHLAVITLMALRATCVWVGALLFDLPRIGLPAMGWWQCLGLVLAVRPLLTGTVGVRCQQPKADPLGGMGQLLQGMVQATPQGPDEEKDHSVQGVPRWKNGG